MDYKLDPFWGRFAHIEPWTYDFCAAGIYYIITSPTECAVSNHAPMGGSYTAQFITIPEKATYAGDDYKVTAIGKGAFMNCPKVKTVTMPQSVTAIGEQAFKNSGLTSIVFPRQVTAIDSEMEVKVFWIGDSVQANIVLRVCLAIVAQHDTTYIGGDSIVANSNFFSICC